MVHLARLAIYKVPVPDMGKEDWNRCLFEDMLVALDDAIRDDVHTLSISIYASAPIDYIQDGRSCFGCPLSNQE